MTSHNITFNDRCDLARPRFAEYCSEPAPTDPFVLMRWAMAGFHLIILEMLQNIYNQVGTIPPDQVQDFALFCLFGTQIITHHHRTEETYIFPAMEPEFKTEVLEEHAAFSEAVQDLDSYLKSTLGVKQGRKYGQVIRIPNQPKEPFNAETVKSFLEKMVDPLFTHLEHEIEWLAPDRLRASEIPAERIKRINDRSGELAENELDTSVLFFFLKHKPPYSHFPPLPWFVTNVVVPGVFKWKDRRLWKYLPKFPARSEL